MSAFIPNSFQVANDFVDHAMSQVSPVATVLYLLIVRKTRGWQKETDQISISQFMDFSGVKSRTTVTRAVSELVNIGLVDEVKNPKGNFYRLSDNLMTSLKNGLVQNLDQSASPKNGLPLVQKMDCNQSKKWTSASPKNGHTKDILLKQENNLLKQGKKTEVFEDQKAILADSMQRESPKPPEPLPTIRGRLNPTHDQASIQALSKVPSPVSQFYQDLRRLCVDLSLDDPCLSLAGSKQATQLAMMVLHLKTNGGFIRAMWYTLAEMGLAGKVAA